jgi:hypothetical protein
MRPPSPLPMAHSADTSCGLLHSPLLQATPRQQGCVEGNILLLLQKGNILFRLLGAVALRACWRVRRDKHLCAHFKRDRILRHTA